MTIEELIKAAAAAMGMPESMVQKSAEARAKASERSIEEILGEWAGVDPSAEAPPAAAQPAPAPEPSAPEPSAPAPAPPAVASDDLLAKAAAAQGMPEGMVKRSAAARAKAEGKTTEEILAEWAGVEVPAATTAPDPASAAPAPAAPAEAPPAAAPVTAEVEVIGEDEPVAAPVPEEPERELVTPSGALPRWLAALFVAVPLFALAYAGFLPNGPNCGDAGQLAVDPVTGVAVNCDGSEFGAEEPDFFAIGADVFGVRCAVCHGANGGGVASFPPFVDGALAATFPEGSCADHQQWVTLGSDGWPDTTYGANDKPVGGAGVLMPAFGNQLTEQELAAVVLYERVQFAGFDLEATKTDCGL